MQPDENSALVQQTSSKIDAVKMALSRLKHEYNYDTQTWAPMSQEVDRFANEQTTALDKLGQDLATGGNVANINQQVSEVEAATRHVSDRTMALKNEMEDAIRRGAPDEVNSLKYQLDSTAGAVSNDLRQKMTSLGAGADSPTPPAASSAQSAATSVQTTQPAAPTLKEDKTSVTGTESPVEDRSILGPGGEVDRPLPKVQMAGPRTVFEEKDLPPEVPAPPPATSPEDIGKATYAADDNSIAAKIARGEPLPKVQQPEERIHISEADLGEPVTNAAQQEAESAKPVSESTPEAASASEDTVPRAALQPAAQGADPSPNPSLVQAENIKPGQSWGDDWVVSQGEDGKPIYKNGKLMVERVSDDDLQIRYVSPASPPAEVVKPAVAAPSAEPRSEISAAPQPVDKSKIDLWHGGHNIEGWEVTGTNGGQVLLTKEISGEPRLYRMPATEFEKLGGNIPAGVPDFGVPPVGRDDFTGSQEPNGERNAHPTVTDTETGESRVVQRDAAKSGASVADKSRTAQKNHSAAEHDERIFKSKEIDSALETMDGVKKSPAAYGMTEEQVSKNIEGLQAARQKLAGSINPYDVKPNLALSARAAKIHEIDDNISKLKGAEADPASAGLTKAELKQKISALEDQRVHVKSGLVDPKTVNVDEVLSSASGETRTKPDKLTALRDKKLAAVKKARELRKATIAGTEGGADSTSPTNETDKTLAQKTEPKTKNVTVAGEDAGRVEMAGTSVAQETEEAVKAGVKLAKVSRSQSILTAMGGPWLDPNTNLTAGKQAVKNGQKTAKAKSVAAADGETPIGAEVKSAESEAPEPKAGSMATADNTEHVTGAKRSFSLDPFKKKKAEATVGDAEEAAKIGDEAAVKSRRGLGLIESFVGAGGAPSAPHPNAITAKNSPREQDESPTNAGESGSKKAAGDTAGESVLRPKAVRTVITDDHPGVDQPRPRNIVNLRTKDTPHRQTIGSRTTITDDSPGVDQPSRINLTTADKPKTSTVNLASGLEEGAKAGSEVETVGSAASTLGKAAKVLKVTGKFAGKAGEVGMVVAAGAVAAKTAYDTDKKTIGDIAHGRINSLPKDAVQETTLAPRAVAAVANTMIIDPAHKAATTETAGVSKKVSLAGQLVTVGDNHVPADTLKALNKGMGPGWKEVSKRVKDGSGGSETDQVSFVRPLYDSKGKPAGKQVVTDGTFEMTTTGTGSPYQNPAMQKKVAADNELIHKIFTQATPGGSAQVNNPLVALGVNTTHSGTHTNANIHPVENKLPKHVVGNSNAETDAKVRHAEGLGGYMPSHTVHTTKTVYVPVTETHTEYVKVPNYRAVTPQSQHDDLMAKVRHGEGLEKEIIDGYKTEKKTITTTSYKKETVPESYVVPASYGGGTTVSYTPAPPPPPPLETSLAKPAGWQSHSASELKDRQTDQSVTIGGKKYENVTVNTFKDGTVTYEQGSRIVGYGEPPGMKVNQPSAQPSKPPASSHTPAMIVDNPGRTVSEHGVGQGEIKIEHKQAPASSKPRISTPVNVTNFASEHGADSFMPVKTAAPKVATESYHLLPSDPIRADVSTFTQPRKVIQAGPSLVSEHGLSLPKAAPKTAAPALVSEHGGVFRPQATPTTEPTLTPAHSGSQALSPTTPQPGDELIKKVQQQMHSAPVSAAPTQSPTFNPPSAAIANFKSNDMMSMPPSPPQASIPPPAASIAPTTPQAVAAAAVANYSHPAPTPPPVTSGPVFVAPSPHAMEVSPSAPAAALDPSSNVHYMGRAGRAQFL